MRVIQNRFTRCKWFVEGDIKGFFDNIDHNVMIGILRKRINLTESGHYAIINLVYTGENHTFFVTVITYTFRQKCACEKIGYVI